MNKKPFVVGERVSVSGWVKSFEDSTEFLWFTKAQCIIKNLSFNAAEIKATSGLRYSCHQNQLRHLKPRRARREFWIRNCANLDHSIWFVSDNYQRQPQQCPDCECIHVREVREKEKK